jgi:hypothetical protein
LRGITYANVFIALVGPPGGRKGTAMKIAKSMVQELDIKMGADSLGSTQALYKELMESEDTYIESNGVAKKHKSLSIWSEEFRVFLSDRDQMLIPSLTDLFDCADVWKYKTLSRKTEDISNCFITLIGGITPALLQESLSQTSVGGGLISRIIFVVGHGPKHRSALQYLTDEEEDVRNKLRMDLQEIANLQGQFKMDKTFLRSYIKWYEQEYDNNSVRNEKFAGYNNRKPLHLNKLCIKPTYILRSYPSLSLGNLLILANLCKPSTWMWRTLNSSGIILRWLPRLAWSYVKAPLLLSDTTQLRQHQLLRWNLDIWIKLFLD